MSNADERPSIAELKRLNPAAFDARVLLVDATPVLLGIAAAALALREQEVTAAKARHVLYAAFRASSVASDQQYASSDAEDRKLKACRDAYDAALARVRP